MCLAVPGEVLEVADGSIATVDFNGSRVEVSLAAVPDATTGDWVLVHAGYAIAVLDEEDARETWEYLKEIDALNEVDAPKQGEATSS